MSATKAHSANCTSTRKLFAIMNNFSNAEVNDISEINPQGKQMAIATEMTNFGVSQAIPGERDSIIKEAKINGDSTAKVYHLTKEEISALLKSRK